MPASVDADLIRSKPDMEPGADAAPPANIKVCAENVIVLTSIRLQPYSGDMIAEFHELSAKIDQLAEMTLALRRENAALRQVNSALNAENALYVGRMSEAQERVQALLEKIPELVMAGLAQAGVEERDVL
jgi:cell division protein ZapB